ncbi:MAG: AAA-like domain-containing protein, partial [Planctomycetota bacterium]
MTQAVDPDFFHAQASLSPSLPCYVERQADAELIQALREGKFTVILSSRKVGKSSLLERAFANLRKEDVCVVKKELAEADKGITATSWYAGLIEELVNDARRRNGFEVDASWRAWWKEREEIPLGQRFTDFLRAFFLEPSTQPWVIAIDEIDTTIPLPFSDDFFAAIRRCQNARAADPLFNRLTFLLAGVASPSQLIKDNRRTPFNIGHAVSVTDFTAEEAKVLLTGLGQPVAADHPALLRVLHWTGGHPFLTQKVFHKLAEQLEDSPQSQPDWEQLVDQALRKTFLRPGARVTEPHLEDIARRRIGELDAPSNRNADPELKRRMLALYRRALVVGPVKDEAQSKPCVELKLCGLLVPHAEDPARLIVRNRIYKTVFDIVWVRAETPRNRWKQLAVA